MTCLGYKHVVKLKKKKRKIKIGTVDTSKGAEKGMVAGEGKRVQGKGWG